MREVNVHVSLYGGFATVLALLASGCTGVATLPGQTSSGPGGAVGSGASSGSGSGGTQGGGGLPASGGSPAGGATQGGNSGSGGIAGTPDKPGSIGKVVPTTQLDPGRVTMRRLNVAEYNNTVRDLLGTTTRAAAKFPGDNVNHGFDTLGDQLTISDFFVEQAEAAADTLVAELLARPAADPVRTRILVCQPTAANLATCLPQILTPFMKNAFRRPATSAEVADMVALGTSIAQSSTNPLRGLTAALKTVLLSPHFMFHVETGASGATATRLDDYAIASRLSYFLWSSIPDATLIQAADGGMLSKGGANLTAQIDRMLADPKAQGFIESFAGQWLSTRDVTGYFSPDPMLFPKVDQALIDAIPQETNLFFKNLIAGSKPLTDLVLADYTFANDRLARHYGLPGGQTGFMQVSLAGSGRAGILTQETFLTMTSQPNRTSPVKRGNWVLEQLLCDPPDAPPPNIPPLPPFVAGSGLTGRAYFERHVSVPYCASCHKSFDPIGFALENYDAVGAYRTTDNGQPINPNGKMPDGTAFAGAADVSKWVAGDVRFARCLTKQVLTYGVGRSFETPAALSYVAGLAEPLQTNGTWPALVRAVAMSEAFLTRRGEGP